MTKEQKEKFSKSICRKLRRKISLLLVASMLGISNVILEEDRMVNDTRVKIEHKIIQSEDD